MKTPPAAPSNEPIYCRCCQQLLAVASPDGSRIVLRCRRGSDTVVLAVPRLGVVEPEGN